MASSYLNRTQGSAGNRRTWTWSGWIKKNTLTTTGCLIAQEYGDWTGSGVLTQLRMDDIGRLQFNNLSGGTYANILATNALHRDQSAWYHFVLSVDTTQATDTNRAKIYVNGEQVTSFNSEAYPSLDYDTAFGTTEQDLIIGATNHGASPANFYNGLMSHVHFIDGLAYDADTFGETDATTGIWIPITAPSVTYGTNGFFLKGENSGALGTDSSGEGNDFTVNGTPTQTIDTPSNVFATLNPLTTSSLMTLSKGNLTAVNSSASNNANSFSTFVPTKGKYYVEYKITATGGTSPMLGIKQEYPEGFQLKNGNEGAAGYSTAYEASIRNDGQRYKDNVTASWGGTSFTTGDIISIALDCDNGAGYIAKNGTYMNSGDPTSGASKTGAFVVWTQAQVNNFGQSFAVNNFNGGAVEANFGNGYFGTTAVASAQNPDDGIGIFEYDVPTGYRALCTKSINAQEYS